MMWGLVIDGVVVEVTDIDPDGRFHPSLIWTNLPQDVTVGWLYDGSEFSPPADPEMTSEPIPDEISRCQFFQQLAVDGIITKEEALAVMQSGVIPGPLQVIIDQLPTDEAKFDAQMLVIGASSFNRLHPLSEIVRQAMSWTVEQKDNFWRQAAKL